MSGGTAIYTLVPSDHVFAVPPEVAVCPYCNENIYAWFDCWLEVNGLWVGSGVYFSCESEPENGESPEWERYVREHTFFPYVYRLPVCVKVEKWIMDHYRFDLD